mmetsp:Transcript_39896/g.113171  ORF Transcript_39896/g.113171 Transcript_39896/m.113171 type:complete len:110 (-) Transcript_39896:199-528(-)|eukprot:CAMPEP_0117667066 /NCGR_PEP_ID=MMETSP0804-20121206/10747_1 /TAXON_ID=1074897 /ORGANISM="Tetraselmis astigmatica, Strain CCMP880" /LENGTH=109 /DNA_ID=CAMNT_0005474725 /DNA_START=240 /DNA_END=569 /DNA_ORIENTATION=+
MTSKAMRAPGAKDYCFVTDLGLPLDPTNASGDLSEWPEGCRWPLPDDVTLACINEPMPGSLVNVEANLLQPSSGGSPRRVVFSTIRDVDEGEELFIDYGPTFDRSGYRE